jgi:ATP synthase protein I
LAQPNQYGPRGFSKRAWLNRRGAASVEGMSDGTRANGGNGKARTDEAALSARLQRLGERLGQTRSGAGQPAEGPGGDRATTASGYARGFRLSSELVAGVLVGAGLGWLIDRLLGIAPWGLIVFVLLGFAAGVLNVMRSAGVVAGGVSDDDAPQKRQK